MGLVGRQVGDGQADLPCVDSCVTGDGQANVGEVGGQVGR